LRKLKHRLHATVLAVLLGQDVFLGGRQQTQTFRRCARNPSRPVESVEQTAADLILFEHHRHGFRLIERGSSCAAALGVGCQRTLEFMSESQVIDNKTAGLVLKHAVDPGDGLHQPMAAHRLIHVHGVQARRVEAREPHVPYQHHAERIAGVAEPIRQGLAPWFVANMWLPLGRVGRATGHHDFEATLVVILVMPIGAQAHQFTIQVDADTPAHTHHHRLAVQGFEALLEVVNNVLGHEFQAVTGTDDCFQLCPFGLELLLAFDLFALGGFLETGIDFRSLVLVQRQLRQPALVIDRAPSPYPLPPAECRRC